LKSCVFLDNNEVWFWGGYFYNNTKKLNIDGFNLLNEEKGLPSKEGGGCKEIAEYGMGFAHDTVMIEEEKPIIIENKEIELE
jgi:hypothetical protein